MRTSKQINLNWFRDVSSFVREDTYKLMERAGFVCFPYSGFPIFLPLGQKVMRSISQEIREEAELQGFLEIYLPLIQHKRFLEGSGRAKLFGDEFMRLSGERQDYILTPTNEEVFLGLISEGLQSYNQLPLRLFQIADKFRDIPKPKGLMRSREFIMADMCSIDADMASLDESKALFETMTKNVFKKLGVSVFRLEKSGGNYVDYVVPCKDGETRFVLNKDYARYAEKNAPHTGKASSVAMYFIFKDASTFPVKYTSSEGKRKNVILGTYGFGIQRCFHAVVEQHRDEYGINFPERLRPFNISVIPVDSREELQAREAEKVYSILVGAGKRPLLDDRVGTIKEKAEYADFIGCRYKVFVGPKELKGNFLTLKERGSSEGEQVSLEKVVSLD